MNRITPALTGTALLGLTAILARRTLLRWGATDDEATTQLPGDEFLPVSDLTATRAITVHRSHEDVWPWLAQLGQGRGGFYSYDFLENLIGCGIYSADSVVAEWQSVDVGDQVDLAPGVGLTVAEVEPGRSLVLRGAPAMPGRPAPYDFTWAFILRDGADGTTRLIARERYVYLTRWVPLLVEPMQLISLVMSRKMLRGIRDRAEATTSRFSVPANDVRAAVRPRSGARLQQLEHRVPSSCPVGRAQCSLGPSTLSSRLRTSDGRDDTSREPLT